MSAARTGTPHLFSGAIAVAVIATTLFAGQIVAIHVEQRAIAWTAPQLFQLKNQGIAFQRTAARSPRVLPLYGSSELVNGMPNRANMFFLKAPTGFQVSPVGTVGATSLIILQKIGALGSDLHGRKVAVSLSPVWFLTPATRADWYDGNFSLLAASEMTFGNALDFGFKRDVASRMLQFPETLERSPLLEFALRRLSSGTPCDRLMFCAIWPFGKLYTVGLELQDHIAAISHILYGPNAAHARRHQSIPANIQNLSERSLAQAKLGRTSPKTRSVAPGSFDALFLSRMNAAPEWADLELLLRALAKVHADGRTLL